MRQLWLDAEQILEAAGSTLREPNESHLICIGAAGGIQIVASPGECSLHAVAMDTGAQRLYRVERRQGQIHIEGWSRGRTIALRTNETPLTIAAKAYTTREILGV